MSTERPWFTLNRSGKIAGVQHLTDERALELILRGSRIVPMGGKQQLLATISREIEETATC